MKIVRKIITGALKLTTLGMKTGHWMVRYQMYERITEEMSKQPRVGHKVLSIGDDLKTDDLVSCLNQEELEVTYADYPQHNILDLKAFDDNMFDYVLSDQVFEHINGNPFDAMNASCRVLKPGGIAIHTTCFMNEIHAAPSDYWRFTPNGLRLMCENFSEVINAEGWGNKIAFFCFRYFKVPFAQWHPINKLARWNGDGTAPISTWVIAKK